MDVELIAFRIRKVQYGDNIGKFKGTIEFKNKQDEEFTFNLPQDSIDKILGIINEQIVETANDLAKSLKESFKKQ